MPSILRITSSFPQNLVDRPDLRLLTLAVKPDDFITKPDVLPGEFRIFRISDGTVLGGGRVSLRGSLEGLDSFAGAPTPGGGKRKRRRLSNSPPGAAYTRCSKASLSMRSAQRRCWTM